MKIETKELDYFKREHMVSYNFTVRTHGFQCWKINVEIRCKNEILNCDYFDNDIEMYLNSQDKAYFLHNNLPDILKVKVHSWLSDFPRYTIREALTMEKLCTARTFAEAEDEQGNFSFETLIEDTWKL